MDFRLCLHQDSQGDFLQAEGEISSFKSGSCIIILCSTLTMGIIYTDLFVFLFQKIYFSRGSIIDFRVYICQFRFPDYFHSNESFHVNCWTKMVPFKEILISQLCYGGNVDNVLLTLIYMIQIYFHAMLYPCLESLSISHRAWLNIKVDTGLKTLSSKPTPCFMLERNLQLAS